MTGVPKDELPTVYQTILDPETFDALIDDLRECARELVVSVKYAERVQIDETEQWTLEGARAALQSGQVRAMQVRYAHQDGLWTDTIFPASEGFRVVRMRAPVGGGGP
jgi:hypothetical protein